MLSRSERVVGRRNGDLYLYRRFFPRVYADHLIEDHPICKLWGNEQSLRDGRFLHCSDEPFTNEVMVWLDQKDDDKRLWFCGQMFNWLRSSEHQWSFDFPAMPRLGINVTFEDPLTAFSFMCEYGDNND